VSPVLLFEHLGRSNHRRKRDHRHDLPRRSPRDGVPIGVATAIYLEEYARKERWYNRLLELNIQNLAAVPAIVYGILGLAFVVRGPLGIGRVLLAGAIILTLVVLPTVIISREAIRAVPESISQGGLALGATKWQVIWRQILPASIPGIATGSILALSRAVGETAPLLLIGALQYVAFDPTVLGAFTALPVQIYTWIKLPDPAFQIHAHTSFLHRAHDASHFRIRPVTRSHR
jgi:phosphate transport system permease protein